MTDPMTGYEQHEAEQAEREDEQIREQHYAEAEEEAKLEIARFYERRVSFASSAPEWERHLEAAESVLAGTNIGYGSRLLQSFVAEYGVPALLSVIARALQQ